MNLEINSKKTDLINIALIWLVFLIIILFSRLYNFFPVDDDWSYIRAAETFYKTGEIKFTPWTSPSLVFQVLWGGLFSLVFGFSVNTLVLSTQAISFFGMVFFYLLLREARCEARKALPLTLLFIFNPFSFPLLFTFFTDQHFIALMLISTFYYFRGAVRKKNSSILLGSVFVSCAVLIRQPGLLIAVAAAAYLITEKKGWERPLLSILLPAITFCIYTYWFQNVHGETFSSRQQMVWIIECLSSPVYIISKFVNRPLIMLEFLGFCMIPFSLAMLPPPSELLCRKNIHVLIAFCLSGVLFFLINDHSGIHSSIYDWINGFHFAYVSEYGYRGSESILLFFYKIFDFLSIFSITFLVCRLINTKQQVKKMLCSPFMMLVFIAILQIIFLMIVKYKFTRYYLVLLPFAILLINRIAGGITLQRKYLYPLLAGFAAFSIAGTQDFISWNEAHWNLGQKALKKGTPSLKLSGGFPWDCWHNMDYCIANPYDFTSQSHDIPWWFELLVPAMNPEYLISNSPVPTGFYYLRYFYLDKFEAKDTQEYYSLLYLKKMKVFLLKREKGSCKNTSGDIYYSFLNNFPGADVSSEKNDMEREMAVRIKNITANNMSCNALALPSRTGIRFRIRIPMQKCRLRALITTDSETWNSEGDGITFKVLLNNNLFENLFDKTGMTGSEQRVSFFKPRGFFLRPRPIYMQYLDPKHNVNQRKWHSICIDLSRFAGKVVDVELVADPGPKNNDVCDTGLWGEPVIETY